MVDEKEKKLPIIGNKNKIGKRMIPTDDMDSDDDLNDIPDTREFAPTDLEGLQAMGLSHVGAGAAMNLDNDDDDDRR